jgi:predicted DNA-binding mobile mystery protein A
MNVYELLAIRQSDQTLRPFKDLKILLPPKGWIAYLRQVLHLSTGQLAKLIGIQQSSLFSMEKREHKKTITLGTLEKIAQAMGCELVYALIPKRSLEEFVDTQTEKLVNQVLEKTQVTMSLEKQGLNSKDQEQQKILLKEDFKRKPLKTLWEAL